MLTGNDWKTVINGIETTYSLACIGGELRFFINDQDCTNSLTGYNLTDDLQITYSGLDQSGIALAKIGYGNEIGLGGAPTGSTISKVTVALPEPSTATLSLLALVGLAARRRRKTV